MILKIIQIILIVYAIVVGAIIVRDYKKNKEEGVSKKDANSLVRSVPQPGQLLLSARLEHRRY